MTCHNLNLVFIVVSFFGLQRYAKASKTQKKSGFLFNAMINEAERQIAAGETIPDEEVWRKYDKELAFEEQEELE